MSDSLDFAGKVALVTGSSRGIGAGIVKALNDRGARCVVNYVRDLGGVNERDAAGIASGLRDALVVECDVGDDEQVGAMMTRVKAEAGGLDILVNNAGILRDKTLKKMTTAV